MEMEAIIGLGCFLLLLKIAFYDILKDKSDKGKPDEEKTPVEETKEQDTEDEIEADAEVEIKADAEVDELERLRAMKQKLIAKAEELGITEAVWKLYEDHSIGQYSNLPKNKYSAVPEVESAIENKKYHETKGVTFNACGVEFSYLARAYSTDGAENDVFFWVDVYIEFNGRTVFELRLSRDMSLEFAEPTRFPRVEAFIEGKWVQAVLGLYEALEREKKAAEEASQKKENKLEIEDIKSNFGIDTNTDVDDREEGHQKGS